MAATQEQLFGRSLNGTTGEQQLSAEIPQVTQQQLFVPQPDRPIRPFVREDDWHVISADQFIPELLPRIFNRAQEIRTLDSHDDTQAELKDRHKGRRIAVTFHEPSTRTDFSFRTAADMMGIGVISTNAAGIFSSAAKGETIEDNARTLDQFGYKAVVIRHGEKGNLARAAMASQTPIINAGDGPGEHPTQALLDADTIYREFGSLEGKHIVFGGDLKYGRTVHSLVTLMSQFKDTRMTFASVPELKIPDELKDLLDISNIPYEETHDVYDALRDASTDVVYWTRTQKERMSESKTRNLKRHVKSAGSRIVQQTVKIAQRYGWVPQPEEPQAGFVLNPDTIKNLPKKARIMHPLPRVDEIDAAIDQDPRSIYFSQVKNGLYCRAALLDIIIENTPRS